MVGLSNTPINQYLQYGFGPENVGYIPNEIAI